MDDSRVLSQFLRLTKGFRLEHSRTQGALKYENFEQLAHKFPFHRRSRRNLSTLYDAAELRYERLF